MDKNHKNIHKQEGNTTKPKKNLSLRDAIIGIITALLVAHFGAKFFEKKGAFATRPIMIVVISLFILKVGYDVITGQ